MKRWRFLAFLVVMICAAVGAGGAEAPAQKARPTMREFMGLNVHTVNFKPALYAPVCKHLRDYHPIDWDTGPTDTSRATTFPMAANRVDWGKMYGSWVKAGFEIDACLMFDNVPPARWKEMAADSRAYGKAFAEFFGPSAKTPLVSAIEVGNEPAKYSDAQYRTLFEGMASGVRAGDPKMKIATCAVMTGKPDQWSKPMSAIAGLEALYDVLNIHSYAMTEKWPTWRRSYPEDPSIAYLKQVQSVVDWRNQHAPGKEVWLTEFGYDSTTKTPEGEWKKWVGVSDEQQAQYIVRSFLVLSAMDIERAYLFFFNDKDEAKLHAASGITRDFKPKPSFHAMAHLYRSLGDYRFKRAAVKREGELYCFEYESADAKNTVYVAWSPTGGQKPTLRTLPISAAGMQRAELMPLTAGDPAAVKWKDAAGGVDIEVGESPVFLWAR